MADEDEFGALYGVEPTEQPSGALYEVQPQHAPAPAAPADEDDLYQQLYGVAPPAEEETAYDSGAAAVGPGPALGLSGEPTAVADMAGQPPLLGAGGDELSPPGVVGQAEQAGGDEEEEEEDDDFMVTLDENATAVEPQAHRFQYQRQQTPGGQQHYVGGPPGQAAAIGAAPGQHMDSGSDMLPHGMQGGPTQFGSRTAIGGIPRSAIPGLGAPMAGPGMPGMGGAPGGPPPLRGALHQRPGGVALRIEDAAFPSQAKPGQPIKLPGQTRVTPEEYREFLSLGHGDIFQLDMDRVVDPPWRYPGIDPSDFFNYGMNERTWREYCGRVAQFRMEFTMQHQIQTLDQARSEWRRRGAEHQHPGGGSSQQQLEDEEYAAFVTAERPPRPQWPRWGGADENLILLAGGEVDDPRPTAQLMDYPHQDYLFTEQQQAQQQAQQLAQQQQQPGATKPPPPAKPSPPVRPPPPLHPPPPRPAKPPPPAGSPPQQPAAGPASDSGGEGAAGGVVKEEAPQEQARSPVQGGQPGGRPLAADGPGGLPPHLWPPANGHMRGPVAMPPIGLAHMPPELAALPLPFMDEMGMPGFGAPGPSRRFGDEGRYPDSRDLGEGRLEERGKVGGLAEGMDIDIPMAGTRGPPPPRDYPPGGRYGPPGPPPPPPPFDRRLPPFDFRGPPPPFRDRGYRDFERGPTFGRPDDRPPPAFRRDGPGDFPPRRDPDFADRDRGRRDAAGEPPARRDAEASDRDRGAPRRQRSRSPMRERRRSRSRDRGRDREKGRDRSRDRERRDGSRERRAERERGDSERHRDSRHSREEEERRRRDRDRDRSRR